MQLKFLRKLLIKDYDKTENPTVRFRYGKTAGVIGIISNAILFALKLVVGIIGGSISIVADAINNLSDAGSSVVTLIGFKLAGRPADEEHPYGHARYEYITALLVALLILVIGALLLKSSIEKIITPQATTVSVFTYVVLSFSIVLKLAQMLVYRDFALAINSDALKASSADSRNDVLATVVVLISAVVIDVAGVNIDSYMGVAVSLFIIVSALLLLKETVNPLIGEKADDDTVEKLRDVILSYPCVLGIHDLMIHSYGVANRFAIVHVEVDCEESFMELHDQIDNIEHDVMREMGIHLNIHMDPIDVHDEELGVLKERAQKVLTSLDESLSLHDFRIVRGTTHTNVLFDVVIPFASKITLAIVRSALEKEFKQDSTKYYFVIDIDR